MILIIILSICKRICSDGDNGDDNDPYNDDDDDADNMQENLRWCRSGIDWHHLFIRPLSPGTDLITEDIVVMVIIVTSFTIY